MKKWESQTPIMSSALIMKTYRAKLWHELKDHPEWPVTQIVKYQGLISVLNKAIAKRSYDLEKVERLIKEFKRHRRIHKRIAKTMKISKRSVKFTLKQLRRNGKKNQIERQESEQGRIFEFIS